MGGPSYIGSGTKGSFTCHGPSWFICINVGQPCLWIIGRQLAEALDIFVIVDAITLFPAHAPRIINGRRFHDQQTDAASCDALVKRHDFRAHMQVILVPHEHAGA